MVTSSLLSLPPTTFISPLGDPSASSIGTGAQHWGIWTRDPGPLATGREVFRENIYSPFSDTAASPLSEQSNPMIIQLSLMVDPHATNSRDMLIWIMLSFVCAWKSEVRYTFSSNESTYVHVSRLELRIEPLPKIFDKHICY